MGGCKPAEPQAKQEPVVGTAIEASGMSMRFPEGWKAVDLASPDWSKQVEQIAKENPNVAPLRTQAKVGVSSGLAKLVAVDAKNATPTTLPSANVMVEQAAEGVTLPKFVEASLVPIRGLVKPGMKPALDSIQTPAGKASRIRWIQRVRDGSGNARDIATYTYLMVEGGRAYTFTFADLAPRAKAIREASEQTMRTLQIGAESAPERRS